MPSVRRRLACTVLVTATLACVACTGSPPASDAGVDAPGTVAPAADHATPIVLLVAPDSAEVERLRARLGADFETVADDASWYRAQAWQLLDSLRIPHAAAARGARTFLVDGRVERFDWSQSERPWFAVVYDGRTRPTVEADIDLPDVLARRAVQPAPPDTSGSRSP